MLTMHEFWDKVMARKASCYMVQSNLGEKKHSNASAGQLLCFVINGSYPRLKKHWMQDQNYFRHLWTRDGSVKYVPIFFLVEAINQKLRLCS